MTTALDLPMRDNPTPAQLMQLALAKDSAIDVIERVAALMEKERDYQARVDFDDALNECQNAIGRIAPNQNRTDTRSQWADYAQLDRVIRPIYTEKKISISFSEVEPITTGKIRIKATVSRCGVSKDYFCQITPSTQGPKGGAMATATDADAIAQSRAKRYLLLDIFNIAVGIDAQEKAGISPDEALDQRTIDEWLEAIGQSPDLAALKGVFGDCWKKAKAVGDLKAKKSFEEAYELKKRELAR